MVDDAELTELKLLEKKRTLMGKDKDDPWYTTAKRTS